MRIVGTGSAVPARIVTNDELSLMVDTSDEWIRTRTGIRSRHIAEEETTLSLGYEASLRALDAAAACGIKRTDISLIICATVSNELRCPPLACLLQRDLQLNNNILAFDLNAACSGFIYALICASRLIREGSYALVVGTEVLSRLTDFTDRNTCVLFGDGAGAAVVGLAAGVGTATPNNSNDDGGGSLDSSEGNDGCEVSQDFFWVSEAQGNSDLLSIDKTIQMDGQGVFKFAVEALVRNIKAVVCKAQLEPKEIDVFICHQANERIIASAAKRLGVPLERFFMNLTHLGNTSAASVPLALDDAVTAGVLHAGSKVVMAGFGGGLTAGAVYFTWQ
ncbi:MAG: ketoacyl-ACP synthase III [Coriobacteriales bacterium]|nr:ketoacyl-ACP synthase III [Coriobacteriales bacterium]